VIYTLIAPSAYCLLLFRSRSLPQGPWGPSPSIRCIAPCLGLVSLEKTVSLTIPSLLPLFLLSSYLVSGSHLQATLIKTLGSGQGKYPHTTSVQEIRTTESLSWLEQRHGKLPGHGNIPRIILGKFY